MALTRDIHIVLREDLRRDPEYAAAVLTEATELFLNGEPITARMLLCDLAEAVVGFEAAAAAAGTSVEELRRMLSMEGNPGMDQLAAIFGVLRKHFGLSDQVTAPQMA